MFDENCFFSRGAPAARQSGACIPGRRWAWGLQHCTRAAHPPTAPSGQGGPGRAPEQSLHLLPPVDGGLWPHVRAALVPPAPGWQGGSSSAPEQCARPRPPDTFLESTYPEMQRKHIPRIKEYQSLTSSHPLD